MPQNPAKIVPRSAGMEAVAVYTLLARGKRPDPLFCISDELFVEGSL